ncbi:3-oxoacyl-[acyl-carrier-protein] synthase 3 protein 1 [Pseudovibrio axinellae]|uniref:3-oxopimeloyl-[acyl-carrier-protein] synthase n=1 Tax=Pseudovibrio axinellae TaxID=989403 RepID=A0A165VMP3_9HYPH|nr:beta-ketoacyl-ACP synthase III [Pseudovibrio axinellae]KZL14544.1 3-oxoacyl-[acyl-carrier-protein] synthase 3 protein 1 [Pseudovibrio axinellae]SER86501.1 3-oxoacyl-[acyl-carrier-protein] synthase-3 [Pseudovibrio axinellae]
MNSFNDRGGVIGFGHYAPERRVPNAEIEQDLELGEGWIERRTGIRARRYAAPDQALTDIALPAAQMAIENAGIDPTKIGVTLLATSTPDHLLPPSAPLLVHKLGLPNSGGIDMAGACAGFLYALAMADAYAKAQGTAVLVVAANILSRRINPMERASRVLFADAAGAVVVTPPTHGGQGILAADLASDGTYYDLIKTSGGGSSNPYRPDMDPSEYLMSLKGGQTVFAKAVTTLTDSAMKVLDKAGLKPSDVDHWIPHQANSRIINAVGTNLGLNSDKTLMTLGEYGNSSAATIPFSLSKCREQRSYKTGDKLLLSAIGAGFVSGTVLVGI